MVKQTRKINNLCSFSDHKYKICVSGAADLLCCSPNIKELGERLGQEIVRQSCILLTGATTGVPYLAAKGAKKAGGVSIGFSPAGSRQEHINTYKLPVDYFDLIVYTGFDYVGRNLILTKSADGVIIVCGRTGTLNEFTIAFETRTPVGVLQGSGGTADLIEPVLSKGYRPKTKIVYDTDPKKLVEKLIKVIAAEQRKTLPKERSAM
ncbi:hypothetical protein COT20_01705 [bacterium (Candidatus Gribaldobacteria) CG08_land_8_20_14_0_20_39_15]|uniref:Protein containing YHS domain protein n=1 Tax=bacterium (Candidatus Gribaldobacteria) CG08_land_8_20_14_0_20_39_15 TaxID=2014273 RepID=A0A2M6XUG4_9BACT|nr:MAG: hypothetical protein COT20_01705 [bacterium (Candidatus Gribaldobacteria) CG08_land_8_20_14_0_20_39_15]